MADYSSIKGNRISYLDSDPTLSSANEGQVWYNSATGGLKGLVQIKAWSAGGNMNTARSGGSGSGSQTAALSFGGTDTPGARTTATESYSGYVWTTSPNSMNTARANLGAAGTQTATLAFGGVIGAPTFASQSATESWNGTSWTTSPATINTARYSLAGFGTQTAAVAAGGTTGTETELYDGTAWTSNPTGLNTSRRAMGSAGTQTAGLVFGGGDGPAASAKTATESWNGSTWTSVNSIGTARYSLAGFGTQTSAVAALGNLVPGTITAATEEYDGTSWITTISASTARGAIPGSAGTSKAGLVFGGYTTVRTTTTEEYFSDIANYSASSGAAWSSGANYPTNVQGSGSDGTQTAAYSVGGTAPGTIPGTKLYDGTSWTDDANSLNNIRAFMGSCGTQTAGFVFGGDPATNAAEQWDGSTWTSSSPYDSPKGFLGACGNQTAALGFGGFTGPPTTRLNTTESWDGSTWTAAPNLTTIKQGPGGFGTQTAAVAFGGLVSYPPTVVTNTTDEYNGSSWSSGGTYPTSLSDTSGTGTQTAGLGFGGYITSPPYYLSSANFYNGTAWTATSSLSEGKFYVGKAGGPTGQTYGLAIGGSGPTGATNSVEEFSLGAPASPTGAAASTLTTS